MENITFGTMFYLHCNNWHVSNEIPQVTANSYNILKVNLYLCRWNWSQKNVITLSTCLYEKVTQKPTWTGWKCHKTINFSRWQFHKTTWKRHKTIYLHSMKMSDDNVNVTKQSTCTRPHNTWT